MGVSTTSVRERLLRRWSEGLRRGEGAPREWFGPRSLVLGGGGIRFRKVLRRNALGFLGGFP